MKMKMSFVENSFRSFSFGSPYIIQINIVDHTKLSVYLVQILLTIPHILVWFQLALSPPHQCSWKHQHNYALHNTVRPGSTGLLTIYNCRENVCRPSWNNPKWNCTPETWGYSTTQAPFDEETLWPMRPKCWDWKRVSIIMEEFKWLITVSGYSVAACR